MKRSIFALPAVALLSLALLAGCDKKPDQSQHQTTTVAGAPAAAAADGTVGSGFDSRPSDAPRINVQAVQQALNDVQQADPQGWLQDFEKRVNEIYDGQGVVSIDAKQDASNNLQIVGYISQSGQQGFQPGDEQLFSITQTGPANNGTVPYNMQYYTYGGYSAYYTGYYHNPIMTAWMVNTLIYGHPWGGYYTSPSRLVYIHSYQTTYRASPVYVQQRAATHAYITQTYHGAPVTVRPGAAISSVRPGATGAAPVHVTPPAAAPVGTSVAPPRGNTTMFNRPTAAPAAPAYKPYSPPASSGGLFNRGTFGGGSRSFSAPRMSSGRRR
ncbi:MAG: hypothetical protein KGS72_25050 [Cyanobacteria bacterium REEB67]|nr:hypothetical protein [Cyanobacteria bacterium REEB67]